jgi:uncharacterized membrane protein YphA (DoxX/SURF4 family)
MTTTTKTSNTEIAPTTTRARIKTIAYWVTTILGPASFVIGGVLHLARGPQVVEGLHHLGFPLYFASILGVWKILGAVAVVVPGFPRLKEWAYAGFFFDLTAAAVARAAVGDATSDIIAPLIFLALVMASWALRPQSRKLSRALAAPAQVTPALVVSDAELGRRAAGFLAETVA